MGRIPFFLGLAAACGCASIERGFEPNPIVAAAEGRWHVNATTFNYVTGEHARSEWDLTLSAISPDTLSFEIFENSHRSQWGEQTYSVDRNGDVRVAEWSKAEPVEQIVTLSGTGRAEGSDLVMDLETSDGTPLKSMHHFVHPDRWIMIDDIAGQWRTVSILERR
jgi:hypothetical protein